MQTGVCCTPAAACASERRCSETSESAVLVTFSFGKPGLREREIFPLKVSNTLLTIYELTKRGSVYVQVTQSPSHNHVGICLQN